MTNDILADLYLDWLNNFISLSAFADHHHITVKAAELLVQAGRICQEVRATIAA